MRRLLGFAALAAWASLAGALQALLVTASRVDAWVPDLTVLLLVAAVGVLPRRDAVRASVAITLGRLAHSVEPAAAVLAAGLVLGLAADAVRRFARLDRLWLRAAMAGCATLALGAWLAVVHAARVDGAGPLGLVHAALLGATGSLPTGTVTALAALGPWGVVLRLPGLGPLRRRRW